MVNHTGTAEGKNNQKMHPGTKILDIQDTSKLSELVETEVHIDSDLCKPGCNIMTSETSPVCLNENKPWLGEEIENNKHYEMVHASALCTNQELTWIVR